MSAKRKIAAVALAASGLMYGVVPSANAATTVGFCGVSLAPGHGCSRQATFSLVNIALSAGGRENQCVYRGSSNAYEPLAAGNLYCTSLGQQSVAQDFHGLSGNPAVFNNRANGTSNVNVGGAYTRN